MYSRILAAINQLSEQYTQFVEEEKINEFLFQIALESRETMEDGMGYAKLLTKEYAKYDNNNLLKSI